MQKRRRRREFTIGLLSLGLLAGVVLTASPAQAATSNGPYYAEPAWDQKLDAATRFVVLSNWNSEAVLDRETGLVWEKAPDATLTLQTWSSAKTFCINKSIGGRNGWRLPSVSELASLIDPSLANSGSPTLPAGHPFMGNVQERYVYWSASTVAETPANAWVASFDFGVMGGTNKTAGFFAWCVRGGGLLSEY